MQISGTFKIKRIDIIYIAIVITLIFTASYLKQTSFASSNCLSGANYLTNVYVLNQGSNTVSVINDSTSPAFILFTTVTGKFTLSNS